MSWFLKKSDGAVFGPVEDDLIFQWAREGRIVPDDTLSADQQTWYASSVIEGLGMDWLFPLEEGKPGGPVHALVLGDLVNDGSLALDDQVVHKITRETRRICEVLIPALRHYTASLRDTLADEQARAEKLQQELVARRPSDDDAKIHERLRAEIKTARSTIEGQEKEILRLKQLLADESAVSARAAAEAQARIKELQNSELDLLKALESAREKAALVERKGTANATSGGTDYGSLVQSYEDLTKNYDLLMDQFSAKSSDLAAAYALADRLKKESEERAARLEETLRSERDEAGKSRERVNKAEEAHLELVRSYRELNDRYIRYRQKMESLQSPVLPAATSAGDTAKQKVRLV